MPLCRLLRSRDDGGQRVEMKIGQVPGTSIEYSYKNMTDFWIWIHIFFIRTDTSGTRILNSRYK
jgi:hypothetical protein